MALRSLPPAAVLIAWAIVGEEAIADEGGVSFWLSGQYGSLAATPLETGWNIATIAYLKDVSARAGADFPQGGDIQVGLGADALLVGIVPTYVFDGAVLGGQASLSLGSFGGWTSAEADATITGPAGGLVSGRRDDSRLGVADLFPAFSLRWNSGVNNYMAYVTGSVPVGTYDKHRLANFGAGHAAVDGGAAYTYFDPSTGNEFSITAGWTYNFENPDTEYQSGVDGHVDWGLSKFFTSRVQVGIVGYAYQQLTADSGAAAALGDFESRVFGIGPQFGYLFPVDDRWQGYLNARGYYEFAAQNRPEGWNALLTVAFSPRP